MNLESEEHRYDAIRTFFPVRSNGITFIVVADDDSIHGRSCESQSSGRNGARPLRAAFR